MKGNKCNNNDSKNNNKENKKVKAALNESSIKSYASYSSTKQVNELIDLKDENKCTIDKMMSERAPLSLTKVSKRLNSLNSKRINILNGFSQKRNINKSYMQKALTSEISLSSNFNETKIKRFNSSTLSNNKAPSNMHEDVQKLKQNNLRLQNSILIQKEKRKLIQQQLILKTKENEVNKLKYERIIEGLRNELNGSSISSVSSSFRKKNETNIKKNNNKCDMIIKSLLHIIIEMCELLLGESDISNYGCKKLLNKKMHINSSNCKPNNLEDIFICNNEEDNIQIIDQILVLLIGKIEYVNCTLGIALNEELHKIKQWRNNNLTRVSTEKNNSYNNVFSPTANNKKIHLKSASTLIDYNSYSNSQMFPQSPKFCDGDEAIDRTFKKSKTIDEIVPKDNNVLFKKLCFNEMVKNRKKKRKVVINDLNKKTIKHSDKGNDSVCNNEDEDNKINILNCSIGDLASPTNEPFMTGNIDYFTLDGKIDNCD